MSTIFHEEEVIKNLKKILNDTCKHISLEEDVSEYFCPCGYVITNSEKNQKDLKVISATCGF